MSCLLGQSAAAQDTEPAGPEGSERQRLAQALNDPAWTVDEHGRVYRIAFPRYDRVVLGYGAQASVASPGHLGQHVEFSLRNTLGLDFDEENIWWRFRHTFLEVDYSWSAGRGRLEPTVLRADYLRHDASSFIVIPMEQDIKLPAPFDIGVDYELGGFELDQEGSDWRLDRIDIAEAAVLMDFIRDPNYRHRLGIGPAGSYTARRGTDGFVHELAPMSGLQVLYAIESHDGLYAIDLRGRCAAAARVTTDERLLWRTKCGADIRAEVVVVSVNDQPVSVPLHFELSDLPGQPEAVASPSWSATVGVRVGWSESF
ncbi:MAG: hypothetical protein ACLFVJ_23135 [Persicimonas sp.]